MSNEQLIEILIDMIKTVKKHKATVDAIEFVTKVKDPIFEMIDEKTFLGCFDAMYTSLINHLIEQKKQHEQGKEIF